MSTMTWDGHRAAYAGFMLLAGIVFLVVRWLQPVQPLQQLPRKTRWLVLMAAFVGGVIGAKAPFVASNWLGGLDNRDVESRMVASGDLENAGAGVLGLDNWVADGKTITTGLIGAYLAVELAKWLMGVRVKTGDSFALPLAAGLAVGRWGCFFNGCCYGNPTSLPWGVDFFGDGPRHPTQLYEVAFHATLAVVLAVLIARQALPTQRLKLYLIAYFAFRFATEYLRPAPTWFAGLTFYQVAGLAMTGLLIWQWRR